MTGPRGRSPVLEACRAELVVIAGSEVVRPWPEPIRRRRLGWRRRQMG